MCEADPHDPAPQRDRLLAAYRQGRIARELNLRGVSLRGLSLSGLRVEVGMLAAADLAQAKLDSARFSECEFRRADLRSCDLSGAVLRLCDLRGVRANDSLAAHARIEDCRWEGGELRAMDLRQALLTESSFARSDLREARLDRAQGDGLVLRGADLRDAHLAGANLPEADFRGSDLRGADLSDAELPGADFRGALLDRVRWDGACLDGALFDEDFRLHGHTDSRVVAAAGPRPRESRGQGGQGDAELGPLIDALVASAASGQPRIATQLRELGVALENWRDRVDTRDGDQLQAFLEDLQRSLKGSRVLPPAVMGMFAALLEGSGSALSGRSPEQWQALLTDLFPDLRDMDREDRVERLATTLRETLGSPVPGHGRRPQGGE